MNNLAEKHTLFSNFVFSGFRFMTADSSQCRENRRICLKPKICLHTKKRLQILNSQKKIVENSATLYQDQVWQSSATVNACERIARRNNGNSECYSQQTVESTSEWQRKQGANRAVESICQSKLNKSQLTPYRWVRSIVIYAPACFGWPLADTNPIEFR